MARVVVYNHQGLKFRLACGVEKPASFDFGGAYTIIDTETDNFIRVQWTTARRKPRHQHIKHSRIVEVTGIRIEPSASSSGSTSARSPSGCPPAQRG